MPVTDFDVALLNDRMRGKVYDQQIQCCRWLMYMQKWDLIRFNVGGMEGSEMYVRYRASAQGIRAITPWTVLTAKTINDTKKLVVPWTVYGDAIASSEILERRAKNTKDADVNFNYIVNQTKSFLQTFKEGLATDMYSGDGTPSTSRGDVADRLLGLSAWVDNNNTIIGEDRSGAGAYFAAVVETISDPTGDTALTGEPNLFVQMREAWDNASVGAQKGADVNDKPSEERSEPDVTISDKASHQLYENLLGSRMRIMSEGADASYETITFNRKPYDWDGFCPSGTQFMLRKDTWEFCSVDGDRQLVSVYAEDKTTIVKSLHYISQLIQKCHAPRNNARCDITLPE